jgi:putative transposase
VDFALQTHGLSQRAACEIMQLSRSVYRYQPDTQRNLLVITAIQAVLEKNPGFGFPKIFKTLRRQGYRWNHKRVHRVYCLLKLNKRRKGKRRLPNRFPEPLAVPATANGCWSMDFMSDALRCGRRFRTFNILDDFNREALAIEIDLNLPAPRVIRVLERVALFRGYPEKLRVDNGPEFISLALADWAEKNDVMLDFIQPGKPTQNSYIERFNRTYRDELLDLYLFRTLSEVRQMTENWMIRYNLERPHDSLHDMTPAEYLQANNHTGISNLAWD